MPQHILPPYAWALVLNGAMFAFNVLLYWQAFRFARHSNRRIAALVRQVRSEMEGEVIPIRGNGVQ